MSNPTRRTFSAIASAVAGFFAAPVWSYARGKAEAAATSPEPKKEFDPHELMQQFCGFQEVPHRRWQFDSPFYLNGSVWASDNVVTARLNTRAGEESDQDRTLIPENFFQVWGECWKGKITDWQPLPEENFVIPAHEQRGYCPSCFLNPGLACHTCARSGRVLSDCGEYVTRCPTCAGMGVVTDLSGCEICGGKYNGVFECQQVFCKNPEPYEFGSPGDPYHKTITLCDREKRMDGRIFRRLAMIPDVEISFGADRGPFLFCSPCGIHGIAASVAPPDPWLLGGI